MREIEQKIKRIQSVGFKRLGKLKNIVYDVNEKEEEIHGSGGSFFMLPLIKVRGWMMWLNLKSFIEFNSGFKGQQVMATNVGYKLYFNNRQLNYKFSTKLWMSF